TTRRVRRCGDVELFAPEVWRRVDLDHAERDRTVDLRAEALHPLQLFLRRDDVLARDALWRKLEDGPPARGHRAAEAEQLILCGIGAGNRFAVDGPVSDRA